MCYTNFSVGFAISIKYIKIIYMFCADNFVHNWYKNVNTFKDSNCGLW